ncbi:MAG: hypothetical protein V2A71_07935 [Candidatus Eisenbacteria bacterium]
MIRLRQIAALRGKQIDYAKTERLKMKFAQLRGRRRPFYLTVADFEEILRWKFGRRFDRRKARCAVNTEEVIRKVTGLAFTVAHPDKDCELELRTGILCSLYGVPLPLATAVLSLVLPREYAVIDFRVWRQLFGQEKYAFSTHDYRKYMHVMHSLARKLGWTVQEVDHAIWEYDRRKTKGRWP